MRSLSGPNSKIYVGIPYLCKSFEKGYKIETTHELLNISKKNAEQEKERIIKFNPLEDLQEQIRNIQNQALQNEKTDEDIILEIQDKNNSFNKNLNLSPFSTKNTSSSNSFFNLKIDEKNDSKEKEGQKKKMKRKRILIKEF